MTFTSQELLDRPIITIKVDPQKGKHLPAWPHQEMAWAKMKKTFIDDKKRAGIVVVPTGGGKTWLASHWLLMEHVAKGGRLLWLTHRTSLLRQAFKTFMENAFLARPLDKLNLIRISSGEAKWSQVTDQDHIVFSTIQTASYPNNHGFVIQMLKDSPKGLFVVVDEAHHACAPSYFRLIKELKELKDREAYLLGLTATPLRMDEGDQRRLWEIFEHTPICQISMADLINKKILSHPVPVTVKTQLEMERDFTEQDYKHLEQYGELAPRVLESIAKNASRNELIVEHYKNNKRADYGKTIVFAVDTLHARTLSEEFQKHDIQTDYVDYARENAQLIMDSFRDKENPIVIVNVEMLTEGFDAPKTQTIFIARPTRSESLLRQMIGRGLRGPLSGGNEFAYLVTFVDTWNDYHPLDTEIIVSQELAEPPERSDKSPAPTVPIPPELVREAYRLVMSNVKGSFDSIYDCLPHSWYSWEEENDDQIGYFSRYVLVFENQVEGFEELHSEIIDKKNFPHDIDDSYAKKMIRDYFSDTNDPVPSVYDLTSLLLAYKKNAVVYRYTLEEKRNVDPTTVAAQFKDSKFADLNREIDRFYNDEKNSLCRVFYPGESGKHDFYEEVFNAIKKMWEPSVPIGPDLARLIEELPPNLEGLRNWPSGEPGYRLNELWDAVTTKNFLKGPPKVSDIRYAKKPLKSYWGFCRYSDGRITLNPIINSPDVPRFVIEFLLYHEILHAYLPYSGHNKDFRAKEKAFVPSDKAVEEAKDQGLKLEGITPDYWRVRADQFLDGFHRRFKLPDEPQKWK